jgi:hypothetical protein
MYSLPVHQYSEYSLPVHPSIRCEGPPVLAIIHHLAPPRVPTTHVAHVPWCNLGPCTVLFLDTRNGQLHKQPQQLGLCIESAVCTVCTVCIVSAVCVVSAVSAVCTACIVSTVCTVCTVSTVCTVCTVYNGYGEYSEYSVHSV